MYWWLVCCIMQWVCDPSAEWTGKISSRRLHPLGTRRLIGRSERGMLHCGSITEWLIRPGELSIGDSLTLRTNRTIHSIAPDECIENPLKKPKNTGSKRNLSVQMPWRHVRMMVICQLLICDKYPCRCIMLMLLTAQECTCCPRSK